MVRPVLSRRGRNTRAHASASTSSRRRSTASARNFKFKLRENIGALKCNNDLKTSFLNIDGLSDAKLEDVSSYVRTKSPDLFFLLETKRRAEEIGTDISIPGYDLTELRRSDVSGDKTGGGVAFYTRNNAGLLFKRHSPAIQHGDLECTSRMRGFG